MPPIREPWIKIRVGARRSDKLAALPSDSARLGYFYLLIEAKLQRDPGEFASLGHLREVLGRHGRFAQDYVRVGVVHVAPLVCEECGKRHPKIPRGRAVVHDFRRDQRDPTAADRQDDWRDRNADRNAEDNGDRNADRNADRNGPLTRAGNDSDSDRDESLLEEDRSSQPSREVPSQRADVQALLDRGWKRVTAAQRRVLDEVLDRHDVSGPEWAASIIRGTPPDHDPLEAVVQADREWQVECRAQAERDEAAWQRQKAADRESAGPTLAKVAEVFG